MELIDTITIRHQGSERFVMLFVGDLASLEESERVDVLIVSAFPDDYVPTRTSLIGALARIGVSVADLAGNKEVDLRRFSSCWLSRPIARPGVHFHRLLCFEPGHRGNAPELVGDIFRSIVPLTTGSPSISSVAMPLLASGDQGESPEVMLEALTDASVHWLSVGLPLDRIKIIIRSSSDSQLLRETFARVKRRHADAITGSQGTGHRFDLFVSYSHKNKVEIDELVTELTKRRPALRVFVDRLELHPGSAWQQHIFDSLDQSRKVLCAFSPDYLTSKVCKEEFNIALFRHREAADGVLLPIYLYSAELPTYMKLVQYEDVREGDRAKIAQSAERLLEHL
jgi:hypothetical protein